MKVLFGSGFSFGHFLNPILRYFVQKDLAHLQVKVSIREKTSNGRLGPILARVSQEKERMI